MIGNNVKASVLGKISQNLYSAYITSGKHNRRAYVVSKNPVNESFEGIVVAVAEFEGVEEKREIVTAYGEIYYEPEIKKLLSKLKNLKLKSLYCLYEKSCGAIIFHKTKQNTKILLVRNNNGRYWSFPKGHIEEGENEQETAIREIKEETGLDVTLFDDFKEISEYCPFGKIRKRVVFFLAQAFTDNVKIQEEEIAGYVWVDMQQARKMCSYENDLRIIDKAETTIHLMRN